MNTKGFDNLIHTRKSVSKSPIMSMAILNLSFWMQIFDR